MDLHHQLALLRAITVLLQALQASAAGAHHPTLHTVGLLRVDTAAGMADPRLADMVVGMVDLPVEDTIKDLLLVNTVEDMEGRNLVMEREDGVEDSLEAAMEDMGVHLLLKRQSCMRSPRRNPAWEWVLL